MLRDAPDLVDSLRKYTFVAAGFAPRPVLVNSATFDELWPQPLGSASRWPGSSWLFASSTGLSKRPMTCGKSRF
ncbi:MAG: hypothetical protein WKG07_11215 [Hymenobacter sp.]